MLCEQQQEYDCMQVVQQLRKNNIPVVATLSTNGRHAHGRSE